MCFSPYQLIQASEIIPDFAEKSSIAGDYPIHLFGSVLGSEAALVAKRPWWRSGLGGEGASASPEATLSGLGTSPNRFWQSGWPRRYLQTYRAQGLLSDVMLCDNHPFLRIVADDEMRTCLQLFHRIAHF